MHAVVDDLQGARPRCKAAQIRDALLRDDDVNVVLRVIDMRAHRNDGRDRAVLRNGRRVEDRQEGVSREVARAADAVHHLRACNVCGVHVAVDVDFKSRVHGDDAEAMDNFRAVGDFLRTQQQVLLVLLDVLVEALHACRRGRERRARGEVQLVRVDEVEHAVLDDLGVDREVFEIGVDEARHDGVRDVADARLQRQQVLRHAARLDLGVEEFEREVRHLLRVFVDCREVARTILDVARHDVLDLVRRARDERRADAVVRLHDGNRQAMRRVERHVDVVHALKLQRLRRVDLDDDDIGLLHIRGSVAERSRRNDVALFCDGDGFDDGDVELAEVADACELCGLTQMEVEIVDGAIVDLAPKNGVRLVRQAPLDAVDGGKRVVKLRASRSARPDVNGEGLLLHALGQGKRNCLRISGSGEAAHADAHARLNEGRHFLRAHDLRLQVFVAYAIRDVNHSIHPPSQGRPARVI